MGPLIAGIFVVPFTAPIVEDWKDTAVGGAWLYLLSIISKKFVFGAWLLCEGGTEIKPPEDGS